MSGPEVTAEFTSRSPAQGTDSFAPERKVVEGSRPRLAVETQALLRSRLRAAATLLSVSFALFFGRAFFLADVDADGIVVAFLGLVLVVLVASQALLSSRRPLSLRRLRVVELVIFGLVTAFFVTMQYRHLLLRARQDNPTLALATVKSGVLFMFATMSTYGIFIPNTWRRAALVVAPMALAPVATTLILHLLHPEMFDFTVRVASFEQVSENVLMLLIGAGASVYGTHVINTLRTEAFEARQLGQYRLRERIGAGGMGEVFLAEHQLLKRPCALKLIRPGSASDPRAMARFEREVRATARLSHPNTVEIYDYGRTEDGTFYYVMEYLPGLSLADLVERHGPLPAERVIYLLRQACHALQEAHAAGLIHRDIKPANIFAAIRGGRHDVTKLLDFGLVQPAAEASAPSVQLSQEGTIAGSPLYMAPEQAGGSRSPDPRSDLYSLGAVAYFLLTGRAPFQGENAIGVMIAHARDPVTPPSQVQPGIPDDLERIVLRLLAKDPADRFQDAEGLDEALGTCESALKWTPRQAALWWRSRDAVPRGEGSVGPTATFEPPSTSSPAH